MNRWRRSRDDISGTVRLDVAYAATFQMAFLFFIALLLLIPLFIIANFPKRVETKKTEVEIKAPVKMWSDIMITIKWPDKEDIDVDLWVKSPNDSLPVGYSRVRGTTLAILKDITGINNNPTGRMREVIFGDGMPEGRYTVNVHLYRNASRLIDVPVDAEVLVVDGERTVSIVKRKVILRSVGQEITIANFTIEKGKLVGKPDEQQVPLRAPVEVGF